MTTTLKRIFLGVCALWFGYALLFTPSGDDLVRIYHSGNIRHAFSLIPEQYLTLNGRVLGNLFSFLGADPVWLRAAVKTATVALLAWSFWKIADGKSTAGLLISFLLLTAVPLSIHAQVYAWSSGFYNYTIPLALVAWFVARMKEARPVHPGVAALLGFASCLFVEHVTLFLLLSVPGILYLYVKKQADFSWLAFAAGVLGGAVLMFASPVYYQVVGGMDTYRDVPTDSNALIKKAIKNFTQMGPYLLAGQKLLPFFLFGSVWIGVKNRIDRTIWTMLFAGLAGLFLSFSEKTLFDSLMASRPVQGVFVLLVLHFAIAGFLLFRVSPLLSKTKRRVLWGAVFAWVFLFAPLMAVDPIGPRNFHAGTVALILIVLLLLEDAQVFRMRQLGILAGLVLVGLILWRGWAHGMNTRVFYERDRIIRNGMTEQQQSISIPPFPYPDAIHGDQNEKLGNLYFYEQPGDILFPVTEQDEME